MFGGRFGVSETCWENGLRITPTDFFHQIRELQQIRRDDSIQAVCRRMRLLVGFLYEAAKNFELF
jgi:hypothetical protein